MLIRDKVGDEDDEKRYGDKEAGDSDERYEANATIALIREDNGADEPNQRHHLPVHINILQQLMDLTNV